MNEVKIERQRKERTNNPPLLNSQRSTNTPNVSNKNQISTGFKVLGKS